MARRTYRERYMRIYKNLQKELQKPIYSGTTEIKIPKHIGKAQLERLQQVSKNIKNIGKRVSSMQKQGYVFEQGVIQLPKTLNARTISGLQERTRYSDLYRQAVINPKRDVVIKEDTPEYDWYADNEFDEELGVGETPEQVDYSIMYIDAIVTLIESFNAENVESKRPEIREEKYFLTQSLRQTVENIINRYDRNIIAKNIEENLPELSEAIKNIMYKWVSASKGPQYDPTFDYELVVNTLTKNL